MLSDEEKALAIHGDRHHLRKYGVPDKVIGRLVMIEYISDKLAREGTINTTKYQSNAARRSRFNKLTPERQRVARWFL